MQIFDFLGQDEWDELGGDAYTGGGLAVSAGRSVTTEMPYGGAGPVVAVAATTAAQKRATGARKQTAAARNKTTAKKTNSPKRTPARPTPGPLPKLTRTTPASRNITFGPGDDDPPPPSPASWKQAAKSAVGANKSGTAGQWGARADGTQTQTVVNNIQTGAVMSRGQAEANTAKETAKANLYAALAQAAQVATAKLAGGQALSQTEAGSLAQYQQLQQLTPDARRDALERAVDRQDGDYSDVGGTAGWFLDAKKGFGFNVSPVTIIVGVVGLLLFMRGQDSGRKGR